MELFWFMLIGLGAGWVVGQFSEGSSVYGLIGNVVVGVVGALVGGFLFGALGPSVAGGLLGSAIAATIGAILLLYLIGLLHHSTT